MLRYLGYRGGALPEEMTQLLDACLEQAQQAAHPRWVYRVFELERRDGVLTLPGAGLTLEGQLAAGMLAASRRCVLLAATLGAEFDALLRQEQARDMTRAVILDSCGSVAVEAACDLAEQEIAGRSGGLFLTDRFSPGYGDLPLTLQRGLCAAVDASRRVGITVTDSCLLTPRKSVTALIGLAETPQMQRIRGCANCAMAADCKLKKEGKSCAI